MQTERESYKLCDTHFLGKKGSMSVFQEVHASPQDEFLEKKKNVSGGPSKGIR